MIICVIHETELYVKVNLNKLLISAFLTFQAEVHCCCSCPKDIKLPRLELSWLKAQRDKTSSKSILAMSGMDGKEVKRMIKKEEKQRKTMKI